MNDIQLQMCILLSREHLAELQRKLLEQGQQLRTSQQTIAHSCNLLAGLDALLAEAVLMPQDPMKRGRRVTRSTRTP